MLGVVRGFTLFYITFLFEYLPFLVRTLLNKG
jgi:hypothetical protein